MTIDTTLNLGNILTALLAIIAFAVAFTRLGGRVDLLKTEVSGSINLLSQRMQGVEDRLKGQGDITTRVAVIETRQAADSKLIAHLAGELSDLRHGRGFVQDRSAGGIDGEYP